MQGIAIAICIDKYKVGTLSYSLKCIVSVVILLPNILLHLFKSIISYRIYIDNEVKNFDLPIKIRVIFQHDNYSFRLVIGQSVTTLIVKFMFSLPLLD